MCLVRSLVVPPALGHSICYGTGITGDFTFLATMPLAAMSTRLWFGTYGAARELIPTSSSASETEFCQLGMMIGYVRYARHWALICLLSFIGEELVTVVLLPTKVLLHASILTR